MSQKSVHFSDTLRISIPISSKYTIPHWNIPYYTIRFCDIHISYSLVFSGSYLQSIKERAIYEKFLHYYVFFRDIKFQSM